ncbi:LLM class flavin-dependent oxidoreductase [Paenibacillus aquistagni]|uniref:LLM class flavin-dependent oxidoreductase n=1 Tax=Paenibacillus aquistagni TaxID=1852522 RepID=UPI00145BF15A|nr:LLM class flavin-dependent oxidoreductase [Paenibacillus aquistagni]NMM51013.1 LLM class flavin-dependent oxidoreductase [Paenibacillus aquistagni]
MKLSVLDHSQISEGRTAEETLQETTKLAQAAEEYGYTRFWVSEHHGALGHAHSSPEILIAHLAANTNTIRIGSGGVMLSHYSAYKVAENFRLLEALYPRRIDLGIGRAPGGAMLSTRALQEGMPVKSSDDTPSKLHDLVGYFYDDLPEGHRYTGLLASPSLDHAPDIWMLGSTYGSGSIASQHGTAYAYAQFFGIPGTEQAIHRYVEQFKPSRLNDTPRSLAAVMTICADTREEAIRLASSSDLFFMLLHSGRMPARLPSVEEALAYPYTAQDLAMIEASRMRKAVGTPDEVKHKLNAIANELGTEEIMLVSPIHDFESRVRSFKLVAEAMGTWSPSSESSKH